MTKPIKHRTNQQVQVSVPVPVDVYEAARVERKAGEAMPDVVTRIIREYLALRATPVSRKQKGAE